MFVIHPGGKSGGAGGSGSGALSQHLWFFGKFALYFGVLHGAYLFVSGRENANSIQSSSQ